MAGFVGMKQDEKNSSMKPEIGWVIREKLEVKKYNRMIPKNIGSISSNIVL